MRRGFSREVGGLLTGFLGFAMGLGGFSDDLEGSDSMAVAEQPTGCANVVRGPSESYRGDVTNQHRFSGTPAPPTCSQPEAEKNLLHLCVCVCTPAPQLKPSSHLCSTTAEVSHPACVPMHHSRCRSQKVSDLWVAQHDSQPGTLCVCPGTAVKF